MAGDVIRFPGGAAPCELCCTGFAVMVIDSVWLCESCLEVLGVPAPAAVQPTAAVRPEPAPPEPRPSLLEILEKILHEDGSATPRRGRKT